MKTFRALALSILLAPLAAADDSARIQKLRAEIAALEAKANANTPEFEEELHAWQGELAQPGDRAPRALPERIARILAIEPSERTAKQRTELANYFRPLSKTVARLRAEAAAKRKELAAIKAGTR